MYLPSANYVNIYNTYMYISDLAVGNFSEESGYLASITTTLAVSPYGHPKYVEVDVTHRHDIAPGEGGNTVSQVNFLLKCVMIAFRV